MDENLAKHFAEITNTLSCYVDAKINLFKLSARESFQTIVLSILSILWISGAFLIALSFLMYGIAMAIGRAFGDEFYLGFLITGSIFLLIIFLFFKFVFLANKKKSLEKKIDQYEQQLEFQRKKFDTDIIQRASSEK